MSIIDSLMKLFGFAKISTQESKEAYKNSGNYEETLEKNVYSLWDFVAFQEHTQAFHLTNVIGFEEWVDMEEIRRRIKEIFSVEYQNERSLYPYIKTLVDIGFLETINIGGRRKWRKRELLIEVTEVKENSSDENSK